MVGKSLEKLLVNGEEIIVVASRGSLIDQKYTQEARKIASFMINKLGLSFGNVDFEIIDNEEFAERIALYETPLPSWEAGQNKLLNENNMKYRQSILYEMVGNTFYNPIEKKEYTKVYINKNDTDYEIKSVMAHVYGHLHIMYNNKLDKTIDSNSNKHANFRDKYREMEEKLGVEEVEKVYDNAQTLSGLIDLFPDFHKTSNINYYNTEKENPSSDVYDVYKFTLDNVKFNPWEKNLLDIVYSVNQLRKGARIKIMHEGFATFVQNKYAEEVERTDIDLAFKIRDGILKIADVLSPPQLPYYLGFRLFSDIEERWNLGKHGLIYNLLSEGDKLNYMKKENKGLAEILEIVKSYTDWDLIFSYADINFFKGLAAEIKSKKDMLIEREYKDLPGYVVELIKSKYNLEVDPNIFRFQLLMETENYSPTLYVPKGSFNGHRLFLRQDLSFLKRYTGTIPKEQKDIFMEEAYKMFSLKNKETIAAIKRLSDIWGIPVSLETMGSNGEFILITCAGNKVDISKKGNGPKFDD